VKEVLILKVITSGRELDTRLNFVQG